MCFEISALLISLHVGVRVVPAGRVATPAETCTARTGKYQCCARHTPSTGPSCTRWL